MSISEFDWDAGNWPKCGKHGVGREEIEGTFGRPISARYIHDKERRHHERQSARSQATPPFQD